MPVTPRGVESLCWRAAKGHRVAVCESHRIHKDVREGLSLFPRRARPRVAILSFLLSPGHSCIMSKVLPSMRKDRVYAVTIVLENVAACVAHAFCVCPAGLSGCCDHVTATPYCLKDFVKRGLQEEACLGRTEKLQIWNWPRMCRVDPKPTERVHAAEGVQEEEAQKSSSHS